MPTERRKPGRPAEKEGDVKRHPLNMRTTKALRDRLEASAALSGRSLAQEVEFRLEKSYLGEDAALAGPASASLFDAWGFMVRLILATKRAESLTDQGVLAEIEGAAKQFFRRLWEEQPGLAGTSEDAERGGRAGNIAADAFLYRLLETDEGQG